MTSENPWYCQVDTNSITSALDQTDRTLNTEELREFIAQNMRVSSLGSHPARMSCTTLSTTHSNLERKTDTLSHLRQQGYRFANLNPLYPKDLRADDINLKEFLDLPEAKLYLETCSLQAETLPEAVQDWCYQTYENIRKNALSEEEKESILKILCASEALELDLSARYPGAKRFSLSGLDSFLVILQVLFKDGHCQNGIAEYVLGLAHRGRLNVLMTLLGKSPKELFGCFEGIALEPEISGDVKYHRGYSSDLFMTEDSKIHAYVEYNPSHLEAVGPVATGHVRAQIDAGKCSKSSICGIIVHGDSAISGQGVVMETMNMSQTRGYGVGGTIHIILNNQVGFTTSDEQDTRSTPLCSDIAKMFDIPVVHVNADDPKACTDAARFALAWREKFQKDCIIHLIGYRKYGHNESDEPAATQPEMYQHVRAHPGILKKWIENSGLETQAAESLKKAYREKLQQNESIGFFKSEPIEKWYNIPKKSIYPLCQEQSVSKVLEAIEHNVQSLELHPRVSKIYSDRISMLSGQIPLDWGCAELLAFGSIAQEGVPIRLSGQDSRRGTFFQRHIAAVDQRTNESKIIIEQLGEIKVINSLLSEMAVLGFEYGYSKARPAGLTLWEAQFGDFANGAQVIIDQFISAGEQKWGHFSGITMLLPHGYEGEGPEHSSARIERYLQLAAQDNIQICYPSTPVQYLQLLRRQAHQTIKRPLIVFTPKSLLRNPEVTSSLMECQSARWKNIISERSSDRVIKSIVFCSGKIYYDLQNHLNKNAPNSSTKLVRIEQLYPFPAEEIQELLKEYHLVQKVFFAQEEPQNQGIWGWIAPRLQKLCPIAVTVEYIGRPESAAPATGWAQRHKEELANLLSDFEKKIR